MASAIYQGSLIAFINIPSKPPSINTLKELTESTMQWCQLDYKDSFFQLTKSSEVSCIQNMILICIAIKRLPPFSGLTIPLKQNLYIYFIYLSISAAANEYKKYTAVFRAKF